MAKKKSKPAIATDDYGWAGVYGAPQESQCKWCSTTIPPTRRRSEYVFGGHGRPRSFCSAKCRQRHSRANRTPLNPYASR